MNGRDLGSLKEWDEANKLKQLRGHSAKGIIPEDFAEIDKQSKEQEKREREYGRTLKGRAYQKWLLESVQPLLERIRKVLPSLTKGLFTDRLSYHHYAEGCYSSYAKTGATKYYIPGVGTWVRTLELYPIEGNGIDIIPIKEGTELDGWERGAKALATQLGCSKAAALEYILINKIDPKCLPASAQQITVEATFPDNVTTREARQIFGKVYTEMKEGLEGNPYPHLVELKAEMGKAPWSRIYREAQHRGYNWHSSDLKQIAKEYKKRAKA